MRGRPPCPKNQKHDTPKQKAGKVLLLPVEQIEPSPYQARTSFDETEIAALAVSILQNGLLQPVSVRRTGPHRYQLIAGERRLRACRLAKLARVPAILADCDDGASAALGLLENLQRAQLDPFDTARGIKEVIRLWGLHPGRSRAQAGPFAERACQQTAAAEPEPRAAADLHGAPPDRTPCPRRAAPARKPPHRRA